MTVAKLAEARIFAPANLSDEDAYEWHYRFHERLGMLSPDRDPTKEETLAAKAEADEFFRVTQ